MKRAPHCRGRRFLTPAPKSVSSGISMDSDLQEWGSRAAEIATNRLFLAGLVIGIVVAGVGATAGLTGAGSADSVADSVETYFSQNSEGIPLSSVRVESARRLEGSDLYTLDMVIVAEFLNRSVEQNQTAVATSNGRYVFLTQPIDTERPLAEQIGGTRPGTSQ